MVSPIFICRNYQGSLLTCCAQKLNIDWQCRECRLQPPRHSFFSDIPNASAFIPQIDSTHLSDSHSNTTMAEPVSTEMSFTSNSSMISDSSNANSSMPSFSSLQLWFIWLWCRWFIFAYIHCCLQRQLCGLCQLIWLSGKMRMICRINENHYKYSDLHMSVSFGLGSLKR